MNYHNGTSGIIRDLHFSNITAVAEGIIPTLICGTSTGRISDITLRDITVEHAGGEKNNAYSCTGKSERISGESNVWKAEPSWRTVHPSCR